MQKFRHEEKTFFMQKFILLKVLKHSVFLGIGTFCKKGGWGGVETPLHTILLAAY